MTIYNNVIDLIGKTPLVELQNIEKEYRTPIRVKKDFYLTEERKNETAKFYKNFKYVNRGQKLFFIIDKIKNKYLSYIILININFINIEKILYIIIIYFWMNNHYK